MFCQHGSPKGGHCGACDVDGRDFLTQQRETLAVVIEAQVERHLRLGGIFQKEIDARIDKPLLIAQIYAILQEGNVAILSTGDRV